MHEGALQLVHGLHLGGDLIVPAAAVASDREVDFEVRLGPPAVLDRSAPAGELVAALDRPGARYAATLQGETLIARFYEVAEFRVDLSAGTITAQPTPGLGEAMIPLLLAGNLLSLVLGIRGEAVLHAATVEVNGQAIAFAGPAGAGKSTAAALMCAAGASLIGDDMARLEQRKSDFVVHHGPHELRLRLQAEGLAEIVGGARRTTEDGRVAVEARPAAGALTRLGAVVLPRWPRDARSVKVTRARPREALDWLLRCPRVTGWLARDPIRIHFDACAALAQAVPVFTLELPSGRLEDRGLPDEVEHALADMGALGEDPTSQ